MKWFVADLHFDNKELFPGTRGSSFEDMDEWRDVLLTSIHLYVQPCDTLYILGDFTYTRKAMVKYRQILPKKVNFFLIRGNHDPSLDTCKKIFGQYNARDTMEVRVKDMPTWLSHYPHAYWPKSHYGAFHLYGHMHGMREHTMDCNEPRRRSMDVSPENIHRHVGRWGPINEQEVFEILMKKDGHDPVSWYRTYYP